MPRIECVESLGDYGSYSFGPLKTGWGITLGNALRRVLLSSLQGTAVTQLKIEGVQHQFSTIPYVKEDVIEFLLNVKALRLRSLTNQPGKLHLDVTGEGRICAYDIKPSADFEIVNPELHLATLDSPEAKLSVEFYVEQGIGYQPAKHDSDMPIGMVPVDAIFSPIRRVNYKIEPMHVGQETYDRLTLEVKTDGTISPAEAISRGAQILTDQLGIFIGLPEALAKKGEIYQPSVLPDNYTMPVESLGLTTRILNCLRRSNITTVGELAEKSDKELRKLPKLGPKGVEEIRERLRALGATTEDKTNPISLVAADEAKPREEEEVTEEKEAEKEKGGEEA